MSDTACDRAFDLLTRAEPLGPADQSALDAHLHCCPSCRDVAHAWTPALELLATVSHGELTGLRDDAEHAAWQAVEVGARELEVEQAANRSRWYGPLGLAAAVLVGCLIGGLWQMAQVRPAGLMTEAVGDARFDALALDSLPMVEACWQPAARDPSTLSSAGSPAETLAAAARPTRLADVQCCTYCHSAGRGSQTRLAKIEHSCRVCHLAMR